MKQTFYICEEVGWGGWGSQIKRKEVVKAFWGKRVLELDVLMTERGDKKKIMQHLLSVFSLTRSFVEHE